MGSERRFRGERWFRAAIAPIAFVVATALAPAAIRTIEPADVLLTDHSVSGAVRPTSCPFPGGQEAAAHGIECSTLTVPERYGDPGGRTIDLAVAVLHRTTTGAETDPVLFLSGGPGQGALVETAVLWAGSSIREDHDLVLVDQRGTGYSTPALQCHELEYPAFDAYATLDEAVAASVRAAAICRDRLVAAGIDLTAYDTVAGAADIERLRAALGFERWNLYGVSYGTRVALEVIRSAPETVRAAVLDSVLPPDVVPLETQAALFDRSFERVIAACAADSACSTAYPGAMDRLSTVLAAPDHPVDRHFIPVLGHQVAMVISNVLSSPGVPVMPALGRALELGAVAPFRMTGETEIVLPEVDAEGLFHAVECRERVAFADPERVAADGAAHPRFASLLAIRLAPEVCAAWDLPPVEEAARRPVVSNVPTLILTGSFDPTTPPEWAYQAQATLSRGFVLEFPDQSHWVTQSPCGIAARNAFFADPSRSPDPPCLVGLKPTFVTDIVISPGLERLQSRLLFGLNVPTIGNAIVLAAILFGFILAARRWPGELRRGVHQRRSGGWWARAVGLGAIAADVAFTVGFALFLATTPADSIVPAIGIVATFAWILPVAGLGALLAIGLAGAVIATVLRSSGSKRGSFLLAITALAPIGFSATLIHYGVIFA